MLTDYVVIDLEMTGLNAKTDRILEAGAARVRGNVVTATFSEIIQILHNLLIPSGIWIR